MGLLQSGASESDFSQFLVEMGYEQFALTHYDTHWQVSNTPDLVSPSLLSWHQHFHQHQYDTLDEIGNQVKQHSRFQLWDLYDQRKTAQSCMQLMISEALDYGLSAGVSMPLGQTVGQQAILVLHHKNVAKDFQQQPQHLLSIQMLANMYLQQSQIKTQILSVRECEILQLAVTLSTQQIAEKIHRTPRTVTFHLENIKTKLNAKSKSEAIYKALKLSLIT